MDLTFQEDVEIRESFGDYLKRHREASGKTLDAICRTTRIPKRYLQAFEDNDIARFPEDAFSRGFIRSYAAEIGLDVEESLARYDRFRRSLVPTQIKEVRKPNKMMLLGEDGEPSKVQAWLAWVLGVGVLGIAVIAAVLWFIRSPHEESVSIGKRESGEVQETETATSTEPPSIEQEVNTAVNTKAPMVTPVTPSILSITAIRDAKFSVRLDENGLQEISLKQGESQSLNVFREVEIRSPDKTAFKFQYNGKPLEVSGPVIKLFNKNLFTKK